MLTFFILFNEFFDIFEILDTLFIFSSVLFKFIILLFDSIESSNKFLCFKLFPNNLDLFSELLLVFILLSRSNLFIYLFNFLFSFFFTLKLILILLRPLFKLLFILQ